MRPQRMVIHVKNKSVDESVNSYCQTWVRVSVRVSVWFPISRSVFSVVDRALVLSTHIIYRE